MVVLNIRFNLCLVYVLIISLNFEMFHLNYLVWQVFQNITLLEFFFFRIACKF